MKAFLVVDDSEVVRSVARQIIEKLNFRVSEAASGQEAIDFCQKTMPDAILYDAHMPPMASVEFLTTVRNMPKGDTPVIIYCVTDNDSAEIARALTAGADDYVLKPFDSVSLKAKLVSAELLADA